MQLSCPICKVPLTEKKMGSASYHTCESHGVWATIAFFSKFRKMRPVAADIFHARRFLCGTSETPLNCPQCFSAMKATEYKKVPGLILDQCFFCNGIWFDRGELNAIPDKAELEPEFSYRPLAHRHRTEDPHRAKVSLSDGSLPEDPALTPMTFLGLPSEEMSKGSGVSVAAVILALLCIIFSLKGFRSEDFYNAWAFFPQEPMKNHGLNILTSVFLHGSWLHLIGNIYFLYITADNVEEVKGPYFLLALFFSAALAGKLVYAASGATVPSIGASGGVCGIMAYYAMAFPNNRIRFWNYHSHGYSSFYTLTSQILLFFYLITQTLYYLLSQSGVFHGRTNFLAHIAGLAVGLIAYVLTADHSVQT